MQTAAFARAAAECDPDHGTDFARCLRYNLLQLVGCRQSRWREKRKSAFNRQALGAPMYSILVLICTTALSHADCQAKTAIDVVRGPTVDNPMMCAFNAQTMIARTDFVQGGQYMKVVCTPSKNAEEWVAEVEARKAAVQ
jgi:hypothetical protein